VCQQKVTIGPIDPKIGNCYLHSAPSLSPGGSEQLVRNDFNISHITFTCGEQIHGSNGWQSRS
jgi:hypothetical protein